MLRKVFDKFKDPYPDIERDRYVNLHGDPVEGSILKKTMCNAGFVMSVFSGIAGVALGQDARLSASMAALSFGFSAAFRHVRNKAAVELIQTPVIIDTKPVAPPSLSVERLVLIYGEHWGSKVTSVLFPAVGLVSQPQCYVGMTADSWKRSYTLHKVKKGDWTLIDPDQMQKRRLEKKATTTPALSV